VDTTDGPVNIVFVGAASLATIRQALRPVLACRSGACTHPMHTQFRRPGSGTLFWVGDGAVKTASSYVCPFPDGGPADYHLRPYRGPNIPGWGHTVLGTAHMDCERARRFGWQERAERFVTAVLSRTFATAPNALNLSNAWASTSSWGGEHGRWQYFGRPAWHCMESDGKATIVYVSHRTIYHYGLSRLMYRQRTVVERLVNRLGQFRRIAVRYEKRAVN
jgi:hypothetical protein